MKHLYTLLFLLCAWQSYAALNFTHLSDEFHVSGPKRTAKELQGRVIVVENWGSWCGPCVASLPHMAQLDAKYAKDKRLVIIGAHISRGRNDDYVRELLKKKNCRYSVYERFGIEGAPTSVGVPFAYIYDHKGNCVWNGRPATKEFDAAIEKAVAAAPVFSDAGTSLVTTEAVYHKAIVKKLVVGKNVEAALNQLKALSKRKGDAADEAAALLAECREWAESTEENLQQLCEKLPSKALEEAQLYIKTMPKQAASLKKKLEDLIKQPGTAELLDSRKTLAKLSQVKTNTATARKNLCKVASVQLQKLEALQLPEDHADYKDIKALWEAFIKRLSADD